MLSSVIIISSPCRRDFRETRYRAFDRGQYLYASRKHVKSKLKRPLSDLIRSGMALWPPQRQHIEANHAISDLCLDNPALAAAGSAWYAMQPLRRVVAVRDRRLRRPVGRFRVSFVMLSGSAEKSLLAIALYLLNWGMATGGAAICVGAIAGLRRRWRSSGEVIRLQAKPRQDTVRADY